MRAVLLAVLVALFAGCSVISVDLTPRIRPLEEHTVEGSGEAKILLTDVSGFISDKTTASFLSIGPQPVRVPFLVRFREELKKAEEDHHVRALIVRLNTPGGTVTASDIAFRELEMFKAKTKVPVIAVMMDLAASGGYYIALAADRIVAHPTTVTGSIGTVMVSFDAQGLMEKLGVASRTIKSGALKDMGSPFRPLTPEERGIFQGVIDDMYQQFVTKVAERRHLPIERVRGLADGRIYTAEQALKLGLVDRIGYMNDAVEVAREVAGVEKARVIVYRRPRQYRATYYAGTETPETDAGSALGQMATMAAGGPMFCYVWWP